METRTSALIWVFLCFLGVALSQTYQYGLIMDAGSSGTRLYIYKWLADAVGLPSVLPASNISQEWTKKVNGGIAQQDPAQIPAYLGPFVNFSKEKVPESLHPTTPIYLKATAGMRVLPKAQQNAIINAVRDFLSTSGFKFKPAYAKVISGIEEGVFGWVATNFLLGNFDDSATSTVATGDLGGVSTQITFQISEELLSSHHVPLVVGTRTYSLYSYSYLPYGNDALRNQKNDWLVAQNINGDPCLNIGFFETLNGTFLVEGTSNYTKCVEIVRQLLKLSSAPDTSIDGNFQPKIPASQSFIGISAYVYARQDQEEIANNDTITLAEYLHAAEVQCTLTSEEVLNFTNSPYASTDCFEITLATELLHTAYRMNDDRVLQLPAQINGYEPTYALGAMIQEANLIEYKIASNDTSVGVQYGLMIDAGLSGTHIYVYKWDLDPATRIPAVSLDFNLTQPASMVVRPGIASYLNDLAGLTASLETLLNYAKGFVPADQRATTPLYLFATGGMRLLPIENQTTILNSIRSTLASSEFDFGRADVISGTEEGLFGWLAVNYLHGTIQLQDPFVTVGALDLGGSSTQITFVPSSPPPAYNHVPFQVGDVIYDVYSKSYLYYGNDLARDKKNDWLVSQNMTTDPCSPIGYTFNWTHSSTQKTAELEGGSNYTGCVAIIQQILTTTSDPDTSLFGTYMPQITDEFFIAFSGYATAENIFASVDYVPPTPHNVTSADFGTFAEKYCELNYTTIDPSGNDSLAYSNCFLGAYAAQLLAHGYKMPPTGYLNFASSINNISVSWALGAMLFEASLIQARFVEKYLSAPAPVPAPGQVPAPVPEVPEPPPTVVPAPAPTTPNPSPVPAPTVAPAPGNVPASSGSTNTFAVTLAILSLALLL